MIFFWKCGELKPYNHGFIPAIKSSSSITYQMIMLWVQVFQHSGGRPGNKVPGNIPNLHLQGGV